MSRRDLELLKWGRHFRLPGGAKAVVGRNHRENEAISALVQPGDLMVTVQQYPGPIVPGVGAGPPGGPGRRRRSGRNLQRRPPRHVRHRLRDRRRRSPRPWPESFPEGEFSRLAALLVIPSCDQKVIFVAAGFTVKTQIPLNPPLLKGDFKTPL